jgi:hypothetical protein
MPSIPYAARNPLTLADTTSDLGRAICRNLCWIALEVEGSHAAPNHGISHQWNIWSHELFHNLLSQPVQANRLVMGHGLLCKPRNDLARNDLLLENFILSASGVPQALE